MAFREFRLPMLAALAALAFLAGCPRAPQLAATPLSTTFGATDLTRNVFVRNTGGGALNWTVETVVRAGADAPWVPGTIPWLTVSPASGVATNGTDRIELSVSRAGQAVGIYNNTGIRIVTNGGTQIIPVAMSVQSVLSVNPAIVPVSPTATTAGFTVRNAGLETLAWEALFLPDPDNPASARPIAAADGVTVSPNPGSTAPNGTTQVSVAFEAGRADFALRVRSAGGDATVRFRFGATLEGLAGRPSPLPLYVDNTPVGAGQPPRTQTATNLRIANTGPAQRNWTLRVVDKLRPETTPSIRLSQTTGSTPAGGESVVQVAVIDAAQVEIGSGFYELLLQSGEGIQIIPITLEVLILPAIAISEPPLPNTPRPEIVAIDLLDFGRTEVQQVFYVANVGPTTSRLQFRITHPDQDVENPLIIDVRPLQATSEVEQGVFFHPQFQNRLINATPVVVTVDRTRLTEDVEFRELTIQAVDADFNNVIEAVAPKSLRVRVERQPLAVQGAANRARPPFLMRFVFQLRDSLGRAIPTQTPADLDRIRFVVQEEGQVLDPNETGIFVSPPTTGYGDGNLYFTGNAVLMLDYSASMRFAGTDRPNNPLAPGEALAQVRDAAIQFIDDMPPGYKLALMYHSRRQQPNRLIHPLSEDKESLKAALSSFTIPVTESLQSDIRDAVAEAVELLAGQNSIDTLPFDDADVNAVIYITDGRDNASARSVQDLSQFAQDNLVRLFPLSYSAGSGSDIADLIVLATDTGGHFHNGVDVNALLRLLANERGLALTPSINHGNFPNIAEFRVVNRGNTALNWNIATVGDLPWVQSFTPNGGALNPGAERTVQARVNPAALPLNSTTRGTVAITSNLGRAEVDLAVSMGADPNNTTAIALTLRDEPGQIWNELANQIVLTYNTPSQAGGTYLISAFYTDPAGATISGSFQRDGVFFPGDDIGGQVSLRTRGLDLAAGPGGDAAAEVYVYADYVPTRVSQLRFRFFLRPTDDLPAPLFAAAVAALEQATVEVALAPRGLLTAAPGRSAWRIINEGDGRYIVLTEQVNPLPYSVFGNLLRLRIGNLGDYVALFDGRPEQPGFLVETRMDNDIYFAPATPTRPSETRYFMYPGGATYPTETLLVGIEPDIAQPAANALVLANPGIDPEAPFAWDRDEDFLPDFDDPFPDDATRPGTLVVPSPLEFPAPVASLTVRVRNDRLDTITYTWDFAPGTLPAGRLTLDGAAPETLPPTTLAPGQTATYTLAVNRAGLAEGVYRGQLLLTTDLFGTEEVPVTVVVID